MSATALPTAAHSQPPPVWVSQQAPIGTPFTPDRPRPFVPPTTNGQNKIQHMGDQDAINKKDESLRRFDGSAAKFSNWAKHFVDHMARVHPAWRKALEWFGASQEDL